MRHDKSDARYTDHGTPQEHCSLCRYFMRPDACELVFGRINPKGWCRFFEVRGMAALAEAGARNRAAIRRVKGAD